MKEDWLAILNPSSGASKGKDHAKKAIVALDKARVQYTAIYTDCQGAGTTIAKQKIEEGYRKIIIIGGDGTINEVVNGVHMQTVVASQEITLAILPIGTGNDVVRTLNIPTDIQKAAEFIKIGQPQLIDSGSIVSQYDNGSKTNYFVNVAGIGFDASVVLAANKGKAASGKWTYLWALLTSLWTYKTSNVTFTIDDNAPIEGKFFSVNVANCKYAGGGMKVAADAIPDDGLFEIITIGNISKPVIAWHVPKLYKGNIEGVEGVDGYRGTSIKVDAEPDIYIEAEGELFGKTPIEIELIPNSINIIKP